MRLLTALRRRPDPAVAVITAGLALAGIADRSADRPADALGVVLVLAATLPVAVRPRAPLPVLGVCAAALAAALGAGYAAEAALIALGWLVGCVAATYPTRTALAATAGSSLVVLAAPLLREGRLNAGDMAGGLVLLSLPFLVGDRIRARREAAEAAARGERERIARDLHDTVAHALSVVAVQADAGEALLDRDPERARAALEAIRSTARDALGDVRAVVAALRDGEGPGLEGLHGLVEAARAGGLAVDLVDRRPAAVPPRVSAAAYRIAQEALTNVRRHAGAARAEVLLAADGDALLLRVEDDGAAEPGPGGNGIAGMRERARLCGGQLEAGPREGGGFAVVARLPLGSGA